MKTLLSVLLFVTSTLTLAQKPKNGRYEYTIAFAEWEGRSLGTTCTVWIKGDSIKVIHNGRKGLIGMKGGIIDAGIIMKHKKTGKWIIGHSANDIKAKEIGGCSDGPTVVDFKKRKIWSC